MATEMQGYSSAVTSHLNKNQPSEAVDEIDKIINSYDKNNDGKFSRSEVRNIIYDLRQEKKIKSLLVAVSVMLFLIVIGSLAAMFGVVLAGNEMTKENHVNGNDELVAKGTGAPLQIESAETLSSLWDAPTLAPDLLSYVKTLDCVVNMTGVAAVGKWVDMSFSIGSKFQPSDSSTELYLLTVDGFSIYIDNANSVAEVTMPLFSASPLELADEAPANAVRRRRVLYQTAAEDQAMLYQAAADEAGEEAGEKTGEEAEAKSVIQRMPVLFSRKEWNAKEAKVADSYEALDDGGRSSSSIYGRSMRRSGGSRSSSSGFNSFGSRSSRRSSAVYSTSRSSAAVATGLGVAAGTMLVGSTMSRRSHYQSSGSSYGYNMPPPRPRPPPMPMLPPMPPSTPPGILPVQESQKAFQAAQQQAVSGISSMVFIGIGVTAGMSVLGCCCFACFFVLRKSM